MRWAEPKDYAALGELMFDAVHNGPSPYTQAQRAAWMPAPRAGAAWDARLGAQAIVLEEQAGAILGFMSLARQGYIDFAYIRAAARGSGLFKRLYAEIERMARARGEPRLWVHASLAAKPAFAAAGFAIVERESVALGDQMLDRFVMEKRLA